jgi:phage shock protein PspC (stress-responsive transcriptional regulator)
MTLAEELTKLEQMHQRGALTDTEFAQAKSRLLQTPAALDSRITAINGLRRSRSDSWIGGVCGGLARFTGMDAWVWRLLFTLTLLAGGIGFVLYVLLWILVPQEDDFEQLPYSSSH